MPSNIEIKAHQRKDIDQETLAEQMSGSSAQTIRQKDTFFVCQRGRLKLREFADGHGELIAYHRPDTPDAKQSQYRIFHAENASALELTLRQAMQVRGVVSKTRRLWLVGQTRIHFDQVEGLGNFIELEVVMAPEDTVSQAQQVCQDLQDRLQIRTQDLIRDAYIDLLDSSDQRAQET